MIVDQIMLLPKVVALCTIYANASMIFYKRSRVVIKPWCPIYHKSIGSNIRKFCRSFSHFTQFPINKTAKIRGINPRLIKGDLITIFPSQDLLIKQKLFPKYLNN